MLWVVFSFRFVLFFCADVNSVGDKKKYKVVYLLLTLPSDEILIYILFLCKMPLGIGNKINTELIASCFYCWLFAFYILCCWVEQFHFWFLIAVCHHLPLMSKSDVSRSYLVNFVSNDTLVVSFNCYIQLLWKTVTVPFIMLTVIYINIFNHFFCSLLFEYYQITQIIQKIRCNLKSVFPVFACVCIFHSPLPSPFCVPILCGTVQDIEPSTFCSLQPDRNYSWHHSWIS